MNSLQDILLYGPKHSFYAPIIYLHVFRVIIPLESRRLHEFSNRGGGEGESVVRHNSPRRSEGVHNLPLDEFHVDNSGSTICEASHFPGSELFHFHDRIVHIVVAKGERATETNEKGMKYFSDGHS